jgi:peptidoglycan hydrolase CwlO-like protein
MTQLYLQLVQSVTGAVIAIVSLLIVAGVIGYLTSWFYARSVYTPVIKSLEKEKEDLLKQVAGLKEDIKNLNGKVDLLNDKIGKLEEKITAKDNEIKKLSKPVKQP